MRYVLPQEACVAFLRKVCTDLGWGDRAGEIDTTVGKAYDATQEPDAPREHIPWPTPRPEERAAVIDWRAPMFDGDAETGLAAGDVLPSLFHPGELICVSYDLRRRSTRPLEQTILDAHAAEFIVANPMRAVRGRTQAGRMSPRSKDNACSPRGRRWLVVEFDTGDTRDAQARLLTAIHSKHAPLAMAVWSGGKSLHGWFNVAALTPWERMALFAYAVRLGADASLWDTSKLVRMPGGRRASGATQPVVYWEPEHT